MGLRSAQPAEEGSVRSGLHGPQQGLGRLRPPEMGLKQYVSLGGTAFMAAAFCVCMYYSGVMAYDIRMYAINTYGRVIHEFDPWFNYRATEVLGEKVTRLGWYGGLLHPHEGFFHWCALTFALSSFARRSLFARTSPAPLTCRCLPPCRCLP